MKKFALILMVIFMAACKPQHQIVVDHIYEYHTVDSVILRDSVTLIPVEYIRDIVPIYDSLVMETEMAKSVSWVDTNAHAIKGYLRNKQGKIIEIHYQDVVHWKDSIVENVKEIPVPVEVKVKYIPTWMKIITFLGGFVLLLFIGALWINKL